MLSHPELVSAVSGLVSGSFGLAILQTIPADSDMMTKVVLVGLAGVLTTFMTTTGLGYLTKIQKMPEREVFDKHVELLRTVNENLTKFLAAHEEWKEGIERRMDKGGI